MRGFVHAMALGLCCCAAAAAPHRAVTEKEPAYFLQTGRASWYGQFHDGRTTANGESFDRTDFTAAHPWLPFGTIVRVTNLANHRMVKVRITDRGPHARSRAIDVSAAAARELGMQRRGVARVRIRAYASDQPSP
jgi:rare lipoprotein A